MFTLCVENGSDLRYLIGFQAPGLDHTPVPVNRLFDDDFGELEDCDILLVDEPRDGQLEVQGQRIFLSG
jgi:hypothetical protein